MQTKQVIVMRTDLSMRKGKMISQGAHASLGVILDMMKTTSKNVTYEMCEFSRSRQYTQMFKTLEFNKNGVMDDWINGIFTKITAKVNSESELELLYYKAKDAGLPCKMIEDVGKTEFKGVKTKTCIAIGPGLVEEVDKITGHLELL